MRYGIFIVFLLLLATPVAAQYTMVPVEISTEKVYIRGRLFYIHRVQKGQTVYSIAKRYGVSVGDVEKHNPHAKKGVRENDDLQIPVLDTNDSLKALLDQAQPVIPPPDTLLVAKEDTVQKDTVIKKDTTCQFIVPVADVYQCESYVYDPAQKRFNVALLLPLGSRYITKEMPYDTLLHVAESRLRSSDNFMEFYAGVLMAAGDMKERGFAVDISVFDVYETQELNDILWQQKLRNVDLILGPVYASSVEQILPYAREHNINIVSPLDPKVESLLPASPMLFQVSPSTACQQEKLLNGISPDNDHVLLVYDINGEDAALANNYKTLLSGFKKVTLFPYKIEKGGAMRDTLTSLLMPKDTLLMPEEENRVIVASNNEALVTDFISNLSSVYSNLKLKCPLTLYGQARWRNFENVDLPFFHAMNLRLVTPFFVDYKDTAVQEFVLRYRLEFKTEPSQFAFQGYDVGKYFLTALHRYGPHFEACTSLLQVKLLQGNYNFQRVTPNGGLINTNPTLIHYTPSYDIIKE